MRLLHTSDWHLGQTLHQFERSHEHVAFLAWLLDTLEAEAVDALLIAGDVFDNPAVLRRLRAFRLIYLITAAGMAPATLRAWWQRRRQRRTGFSGETLQPDPGLATMAADVPPPQTAAGTAPLPDSARTPA